MEKTKKVYKEQDFKKNEKELKKYDKICPLYGCMKSPYGNVIGVCKEGYYKYRGELKYNYCHYPFRECLARMLIEDPEIGEWLKEDPEIRKELEGE